MPCAKTAELPPRPNIIHTPRATARRPTIPITKTKYLRLVPDDRIMGSKPGAGGATAGGAGTAFRVEAPPGAYGDGGGEDPEDPGPYCDAAAALPPSIKPASSFRNADRAAFTSASVGWYSARASCSCTARNATSALAWSKVSS